MRKPMVLQQRFGHNTPTHQICLVTMSVQHVLRESIFICHLHFNISVDIDSASCFGVWQLCLTEHFRMYKSQYHRRGHARLEGGGAGWVSTRHGHSLEAIWSVDVRVCVRNSKTIGDGMRVLSFGVFLFRNFRHIDWHSPTLTLILARAFWSCAFYSCLLYFDIFIHIVFSIARTLPRQLRLHFWCIPTFCFMCAFAVTFTWTRNVFTQTNQHSHLRWQSQLQSSFSRQHILTDTRIGTNILQTFFFLTHFQLQVHVQLLNNPEEFSGV